MKKIRLIAFLFQAVLLHAGNTYYVNQMGGNNANSGTSWTQALATLDEQAMLLVKANNQTMAFGDDPTKINLTGAYDITGFVNKETDEAGNLTITSMKEDLLSKIIINGQEHDIRAVYQSTCSVYDIHVEIITNPEAATVNIGKNIQREFNKPGLYTIPFVVTSPDGQFSKNYMLTIEEKFNFNDIVVQKWDNTLMLDINKLREVYGHEFTSFMWYKNDRLIGTGTYYSIGEESQHLLDKEAFYHIEMITNGADILHTCPAKIAYKYQHVKVYPNPVISNGMLHVEIDRDEEATQSTVMRILSLNGGSFGEVDLRKGKTLLKAPETPGYYILKVNGQSVKIIVK